jgi:hypothetical protein
MQTLRSNAVIALLVVVVFTACYLEFPVITVLFLVIMLFLWFTFRGSDKSQFNMPAFRMPAFSSWPTLTRRPEARSKKTTRSQLLAGIRGFSLSLTADKPFTMPFIGMRASRCVKEFLSENHLLVDADNAWMSDPNLANLSLTVAIQASGIQVQITVVAEVIGMVSVARAFSSSAVTVSDSCVLKTYAQYRVTPKTLVVQEVESAIQGCLWPLLHDIGTSTAKLLPSDV